MATVDNMQTVLEAHSARLMALEASMFGDSSRLLRGHEERLQLLERAVSDLTSNWKELRTQMDTLATVGKAIAWLLGFVGVGLFANIARVLAGG